MLSGLFNNDSDEQNYRINRKIEILKCDFLLDSPWRRDPKSSKNVEIFEMGPFGIEKWSFKV